jgi:hypothetical protein
LQLIREVKVRHCYVFFIPLVAFSEDSAAPSKTLQVTESLKAYDRLGRDNISIRAQHKGGRYRTIAIAQGGAATRTVTSTKDVEVTVTQPRKEKQALKLEFFFIIKEIRKVCETRRCAGFA